MAFTVTNKGLEYLLNTAISSGSLPDIRMLVFTGTVPAAGTMRDWDFVSEALASALDEATASPYARAHAQLDLTLSYLASDSTDNVVISATAPVLPSVTTGQTWTAVGYYVFNGGADSTQILLGVDVPTPSTLTTNGQNVTLPALSLTLTGS